VFLLKTPFVPCIFSKGYAEWRQEGPSQRTETFSFQRFREQSQRGSRRRVGRPGTRDPGAGGVAVGARGAGGLRAEIFVARKTPKNKNDFKWALGRPFCRSGLQKSFLCSDQTVVSTLQTPRDWAACHVTHTCRHMRTHHHQAQRMACTPPVRIGIEQYTSLRGCGDRPDLETRVPRVAAAHLPGLAQLEPSS